MRCSTGRSLLRLWAWKVRTFFFPLEIILKLRGSFRKPKTLVAACVFCRSPLAEQLLHIIRSDARVPAAAAQGSLCVPVFVHALCS